MAEDFIFVFVAMGQGDCCMVRCPDGKVIVVDCGRTSEGMGQTTWFNQAAVQLRTGAWAGSATNGNQVHALILTHPDADHYNLVSSLFSETVLLADIPLPNGTTIAAGTKFSAVGIANICLSSAQQDSLLANYSVSGLNKWIYGGNAKAQNIYNVVIASAKDENNGYQQWDHTDSFRTVKSTGVIKNQTFNVAKGTTTTNVNWSVDIVAGNVPKDSSIDKATAENAASLVTLFTIGSRKVLLTGDSTYSTEALLSARADLANIDLVQVPHHGSSYASSEAFVKRTNPKMAVVSVGFFEHSYRLPRYEVCLERWLETIKTSAVSHDIDYWTYNSGSTDSYKDIIEGWQTNKTLQHGNYWYYTTAPNTAIIGLYVNLKRVSYLFREYIDTSVFMTSQKTQMFRLNDAGVQALPS